MNRTLSLTVAYDGSGYHGFQRQQNALAVQEVLEEGLSRLLSHRLSLVCAGRTDTGVHACGQVVSFQTDNPIPVHRIPLAARGYLPPDIVVLSAREEVKDFHARKSAWGKLYEYHWYIQPIPNPFLRKYTWQLSRIPDWAAMQQGLAYLQGRHDFAAFRAAGSVEGDTYRTLFQVGLVANQTQGVLYLQGDGFLYHMVRNIAGTLVAIGQGDLQVSDMATILASRDRNQAGKTAPPQGLYLRKVYYSQPQECLAEIYQCQLGWIPGL